MYLGHCLARSPSTSESGDHASRDRNQTQRRRITSRTSGTLWLCQNSYRKLPFIVDLPIENGDFPSFFGCLPEGNQWCVI